MVVTAGSRVPTDTKYLATNVVGNSFLALVCDILRAAAAGFRDVSGDDVVVVTAAIALGDLVEGSALAVIHLTSSLAIIC